MLVGPFPPEEPGKKLREAYDHAVLCWKAGNYAEFFRNWLIIDFIIFSNAGAIIDAWGEEIIDVLFGLNNTSNR